jgi:hypothetical protein
MDLMSWLEDWYLAQCNGDWEHQYGVKIDTLENPGWTVPIDLKGTTASGATMQPYNRDHSGDDWVICRIQNETFLGDGDPKKLTVILELFRSLVSGRPTNIERGS